MTGTESGRRTGRHLRRWLGFAGVLVLAMIAGYAAIVGVAALTWLPLVFLTVGWVVFTGGVVLAVRVLPTPRRLRVGVVALVLLSVAVGPPRRHPHW